MAIRFRFRCKTSASTSFFPPFRIFNNIVLAARFFGTDYNRRISILQTKLTSSYNYLNCVIFLNFCVKFQLIAVLCVFISWLLLYVSLSADCCFMRLNVVSAGCCSLQLISWLLLYVYLSTECCSMLLKVVSADCCSLQPISSVLLLLTYQLIAASCYILSPGCCCMCLYQLIAALCDIISW